VRNRFISEHVPERGPACVEHGFRHAGFSKLGRIHVTNGNVGMRLHQAGGGDMEKMFSLASRVLRQARPDIAAHYKNGVLWTSSHFSASVGGASLEVIKRYVENQKTTLKGRVFDREKI